MAEDDILMGSARATDSDGDGVTDAEERLAGTDPNDPGSVVRSVDAELEHDPSVGLQPEGGGLREDFDKASVVAPDGMTIDGGLTGPDGEALDGPNHHGVDDNGLFGDHDGGVDPRNLGGLPGDDVEGGTPPDLVGGKDWDLVGGKDGTPSAGDTYVPPTAPAPAPEKSFLDKAADYVNDLFKDPPPPPPPPPPKTTLGPYTTNPDADPGTGGPVSEDDVEAAILKQGGDTDFGEGGPRQVDTSGAPPSSDPYAPVVNPNPDADGGSTSPVQATGTPKPPVDIAGPEVVRDDLVLGGVRPSTGPAPTEPNTIGREGGDDDDLEELEVQRNTPPPTGGDDALTADLDADLSVEVDEGFASPNADLADADAAMAAGEGFGGPLDDGFDG